MALVGSENRQAVRSCRRSNRDVFEPGIMGPYTIEDCAGMASILNAECQNPASIEVLESRKPPAEALCLGCRADADGPSDTGLNLGDGYGRNVELIAVHVHPSGERIKANLPLGGCIGRDDVGVEQIHG